MTHHEKSDNEWATHHREARITRHSHEDVLNGREFELLLEASGDLPFRVELKLGSYWVETQNPRSRREIRAAT